MADQRTSDSAAVHTQQQPQSRYKEEEEELLRELCTVNGINYEKLIHGTVGNKVKSLEIFFFGCPRIVGLQHFPNLRCLRVVNQKISDMSGIQSASATLEELWICEGEIQVIQGLECMTSLTHLYLYSNKISAISGINQLTNLKKLWLNGNKITKIEGMTNLVNITDLNIADNLVSSIGDDLLHMKDLEALNLSGNPISSLEELHHVYQLTSLRHLSLCDSLSPPAPVCRLCNYSSLVLYHMPELKTLDGRDIDSKDLRELIKNLIVKKKQFYRLKLHNQRQHFEKERTTINDRLKIHKQISYSRMRALHHHLKSLNDIDDNDKGDTFMRKMGLITKRIASLDQSLSRESANTVKELSVIDERERRLIARGVRELESGGNTRFIDCKDGQGWYNSCMELVNSRFITADFIAHGISGMDVTMVTRIEDRNLYHCFSDLVKKLFDANPRSKRLRDLFDYLFMVRTDSSDPLEFSSSGCGFTEPVILTNSIGLAENERLKRAELSDKRRGQLLLCKVYIGNMTEHQGTSPPTVSEYPTSGGVYMNVSTHKSTSSGGSRHSSQQKLYYVFDQHLILPEYCINIDYAIDYRLEKGPGTSGGSLDGGTGDDTLMELDPRPDNRPKLSMLDTETMLHHSREESLEHIKELDLSGNRLSRFRYSSSLPALTVLNLSYNELETAEDFSHMSNLQMLDISFNNITTLQGMKSLPKLNVLDVSWNQLRNMYTEVSLIRKYMHSLQSLDIRHNLWMEEASTAHIIGTIRSLRYLNGHPVSEEEASSGFRQVLASHLSLSSLLPHCRIDVVPPPSLSLTPIAKLINNYSSLRPQQLSTSNSGSWTTQVTTADLSSLNLHKLSCLDQLINLKWVCLQDNNLTNVDGIERCSQLEELTIDRNCLVELPSLHHFPSLKNLSVSDNRLTSFPHVLDDHTLSSLIYLNISGNNITSLQGVECFNSLRELYASRNLFENLRQLFTLKSLSHLMIADFSYTPLVSIPNYRIFSIFHVPSLKCLDAKTISNSEVAMAKEKLGGRLTQDSIYEKFPNESFTSIKTLDFPNCGLKQVDLSPVKSFDNLLSLNIEHNSLTSLSGIIYLKRLKVLCLNHNRVECLVKQVGGTCLDSTPILPSLQVLHLAYNGISQLPPLQLSRLTNLRALFLQGNEISRVEGLNGLYNLTELVLDRNKIKQFNEHSLVDLIQLKELHIEENRLCDLSHINLLKTLEHLFLGMNRIQEYSDLEKLEGLNSLLELSVISNPVSRRMQHRSLLVYKLPVLQSLDGVAVSIEERQVAEMTFSDRPDDSIMEQQQPLPILNNNTGQVKVMSMPFYVNSNNSSGTANSSSTSNKKHNHSTEIRNIHMQTLHTLQDKRRGRK